MFNEVNGGRVAHINKEHERIRICLGKFRCLSFFFILGKSIRHQKVTNFNITEIIRFTLNTSGYFPIKGGNYKQRGIHCYDDSGYIFVQKNPDLMESLKTVGFLYFDLT